MKLISIVPIISILLTIISTIDTARILAVLPVGKSHYQFCINVIKILADRGHDIVVIGPYDKDGLPDNVQYMYIGCEDIMKALPPEQKDTILQMVLPFTLNQLRTWYIMNTYTEYITKNLTQITEFIKKDQSTFDLVIIEEFFVQALYPLARKYKTPLILLSSFGTAHYISEYMGNSLETSYVPHEFNDIFGDMTFLERMINFVYTTFDIIGRKFMVLYVQNEISKRTFDNEFYTWTHVGDIERDVSLVFFNSHYSMSVSKPLLPNMIEIGGLHIKEPKSLPEDIQELLDNAIFGAILFSFGSVLDLSDQPKEKVVSVLRALGRLDQTVLLKWKSHDPLPILYDNIYPFAWLPQNDILAHPNLKAFVTHGGLNSQQEAVHHGIPIVCVPFFGDQPHNCLKSQVKGFGLQIPYSELNEQTLYENLNNLLSNEKFKKSASAMSQRFKDRPLSPKDSIIFWTEYVLRHHGADFLKGPKRHLYWFQITHLDVIFVLVLGAWVLKKIVGFIFRAFCKILQKKSKKELKKKRS